MRRTVFRDRVEIIMNEFKSCEVQKFDWIARSWSWYYDAIAKLSHQASGVKQPELRLWKRF